MGGRGSTGSNAKASAEGRAEAKTARAKEASSNENNYQFSKIKPGTQIRLPNGSTAYKFSDGKWGIHSNGADWTTQEAIKASTSNYGKFTNREMNKLLKLQTKNTKR